MKSIILIIVIVLAIAFSGCISSDVQSSKAQPIITQNQPIKTAQLIITPTPAPTKEMKVINIDASQIILDKKEVNNILRQESNQPIQNLIMETNSAKEPFRSTYSGQITPKSRYVRTYSNYVHTNYTITVKPEGDAVFDVSTELNVYNNIDQAKKSYLKEDMAWIPTVQVQEINIGDFGTANTIIYDTSNSVEIHFVKNNVFFVMIITSHWISPERGAEPNKAPLVNIDTAYKLAQKQNEKITKIIEMIK